MNHKSRHQNAEHQSFGEGGRGADAARDISAIGKRDGGGGGRLQVADAIAVGIHEKPWTAHKASRLVIWVTTHTTRAEGLLRTLNAGPVRKEGAWVALDADGVA
jgi:hypothetical protein